METTKKTYTGEQHDDIEQLFDDAEKLIQHPDTRIEGRDLMKLAALRMFRERTRVEYAYATGQKPNIPPLEPAPRMKLLNT